MELYHYTDLAALKGMIRPNCKLEFWGSRYDCMNDPFDFQFARNRILPLAQMAVDRLVLSPDEKMNVHLNPFVVSFSRKKDDFLMWRLYKSEIALVLDSGLINQDNNCVLNECLYVDGSESETLKAFGELNKTIATSDNVFVFAESLSTFIKHTSFTPEAEVRLASWDYYDDKGNKLHISDCLDDKGIVTEQFFTRKGLKGNNIVFKKFTIDGIALRGIVVHTYSKREFELIKQDISGCLAQNGFANEICENIKPSLAYPFNK